MKQCKKGAASPAPKQGMSATRLAAAASMMVLPMVALSNRALAQAGSAPGKASSPTNPPAPPMLRYKMTDIVITSYSIVGYGDGHTIYKAADGSMFFVDPTTGSKRMLSADLFLKIKRGADFKAVYDKGRSGGVSILGVDQQGHVLQKNARGEVFYLNPQTGDFVFVKWPK